MRFTPSSLLPQSFVQREARLDINSNLITLTFFGCQMKAKIPSWKNKILPSKSLSHPSEIHEVGLTLCFPQEPLGFSTLTELVRATQHACHALGRLWLQVSILIFSGQVTRLWERPAGLAPQGAAESGRYTVHACHCDSWVMTLGLCHLPNGIKHVIVLVLHCHLPGRPRALGTILQKLSMSSP